MCPERFTQGRLELKHCRPLQRLMYYYVTSAYISKLAVVQLSLRRPQAASWYPAHLAKGLLLHIQCLLLWHLAWCCQDDVNCSTSRFGAAHSTPAAYFNEVGDNSSQRLQQTHAVGGVRDQYADHCSTFRLGSGYAVSAQHCQQVVFTVTRTVRFENDNTSSLAQCSALHSLALLVM